MVGVTKIGSQNANYWINAVAEGAEDYYTKPGEAPGIWLGTLALELGLEGEVDREEYTAVLAGQHPRSGEWLVGPRQARTRIDEYGKEHRSEPVLGHDVRFSAPKSVSLLWALGPPGIREAALRAHEEGVAQGLAYLEGHACFVRRGQGGKEVNRGSGFIAMGFLHRSSRAGDPALHTHLLLANMTQDSSDGKWLCLASPKGRSPLFLQAKAAGHVYQAVLRACLTRELGLSWEEITNGYADIAGIARPVIDHFSRRREEIVAEMAQRGVHSPAAAEIAAYRTRDAKDYTVDAESQLEEWGARAQEFDFGEGAIEALLKGAERREPAALGEEEIAAALAELEAHHSHFDRRDLVCALANQMREGTDLDQLEAAVKQLLSGRELVMVYEAEELIGIDYYTTARLWEMEQRILALARKGEGASAAVVEDAVLQAVLERHRYLSDEQAAMVRRLTTAGERVVTVAALPGTGKTTALQVAREAWTLGGHRVIGVATARSASAELEDAGIPSTSVTNLLILCEERTANGDPPLLPGTVIVLDEASTTPTPDLLALVELVEGCGGKLVANGDPRQIGAVGPGGVYGRLSREQEPCRLTEIRRQRDPLDREIVHLAYEGQGSDALDLLRANERVVITDSLPEALDALALDWYEQFRRGEDAVMIARRGRDVEALNERARQLLSAEGALGETTVQVGESEFAVGDCIITRVNGPDVSNRERWRVVGIDEGASHLMAERIGGDRRTVILTPAYLARKTEAKEPAVQHAYALTTYATQSKTFESAFVLLDGGIAREDFLVAISRARGETIAYSVVAAELLDPELGPAMREIDDPLHEIRAGTERVAAEYAAVEVAARMRIEGTLEADLIARRKELERWQWTAQSPSISAQKLARLDQRIEEAEHRLEALRSERGALVSAGTGAGGELARIESVERLTHRQLAQLRGDRENAQPLHSDKPEPKKALSWRERVELVMIVERLEKLRRRQVESERVEPSEAVIEMLGPRPSEGDRVLLWNEGVDLLVARRQARGAPPSASLRPSSTPGAGEDLAHKAAIARLHKIQAGLGLRDAPEVDRSQSLSR